MHKIFIYLLLAASMLLACSKTPPESNSTKDSTQVKKENPTPKSDAQEPIIDSGGEDLLAGVWYSPDAKTALLIEANNGKITKILYAKNDEKFRKANIESQTINQMGVLTIQFAIATQKLKIESGYTPMGAYYMLTNTESPNEQQVVYQLSAQIQQYPDAKSVFLTYFTQKDFINYDNKYQIIQTPQEGAGENEVFFILKNPKGEEEYITAKVATQQHELVFNSLILGTVKAKFDDINLLFYNAKGEIIGTFSEIVAGQ